MAGPWEDYQKTEETPPWEAYKKPSEVSSEPTPNPSTGPQEISDPGASQVPQRKPVDVPSADLWTKPQTKPAPSVVDYITGKIPGTLPYGMKSGLFAFGDIPTGKVNGQPVYDEAGTKFDPRVQEGYTEKRAGEAAGWVGTGSIVKQAMRPLTRAQALKIDEEMVTQLHSGLNPQRAAEEAAKAVTSPWHLYGGTVPERFYESIDKGTGVPKYIPPKTPEVGPANYMTGESKITKDMWEYGSVDMYGHKPGSTEINYTSNPEWTTWALKASMRGEPRPPTQGTVAEVVDDSIIKRAKLLSKDGLQAVSSATGDVIRSLHDRVQDYSPMIAGRLRKFEYNSSISLHKNTERVSPFINNLNKLSKFEQIQFKHILINENQAKLEAFLSDKPELRGGFDDVQILMRDLAKQLKEVGYDIEAKDLYFPRVVKDWKKFSARLSNKSDVDAYQKILIEEAKLLGTSAESLTNNEITFALNKAFRNKNFGGLSGSSNSLKERVIGNVESKYLNEYEDPAEALHQYVRHITHNIEKKKFFGFSSNTMDDRVSIGNVVREAREAGDIRDQDAWKIQELLEARFVGGERAPARFTRTFKNVFYGTTLGHVGAAGTQIGDLFVSGYKHGLGNTLNSMMRTVGGKSWTNVDDLGLGLAMQEMADTKGTAKALQGVLKWSGFRVMDRLGKNTQLNAAFIKYSKQSKTAEGRIQIREKYKDSFTDQEMEQLLKDLSNKKVTGNTKFLLWNELSDTQPISLSELPKKYLENPNGRILYMLQTFTTRQLSMFYKDSLKKIATPGQKAEGYKNMAKYLAVMGAAGMTVSELKERAHLQADESPLSLKMTNAIWRNFGMSEVIRKGLVSDNKADQLAAVLTPVATPASLAISQGNTMAEAGKGVLEGDMAEAAKAFRVIPVPLDVGNVLYMWFGGGFEEAQEKAELREKRREREELLKELELD